MTTHELLAHDSNYRLMLLGRLRCDCDYYLGFGNRSVKHLWAQDVKEHIACMKALWESFPADQKPRLSYEQILDYERQMVPQKASLDSHIQSAAARTVSSSGHQVHDTGREL